MIVHCRKLCIWPLLAIFFFLCRRSHAAPSFFATFPSSVIPGSNAKFCISFQNIESEINFSVKNDENCFSLIEKNVDSTEDTCFDIFIEPSCDFSYISKISISGSSTNGEYTFKDSKNFALTKKNFVRFVETDKPVYKPGDKLRIRVLTLDFQLRPLVKKYKEIYVVDSSSSRLTQWNGFDNEKFLVDFELAISEEPNLGIWKVELIEEDGSILSTKFEIKKYVLPKFEVTIGNPHTIWASSETITVTVCAKYSHGNDVKGNFELRAFTKKFSFRTYKDEIQKSITNNKESKGCENFEIDLGELGINQGSYIYRINFEAKVTEDKTNIDMSTSSSTVVSFNNFVVDLLEPLQYKPGFKNFFKLMIKNAEGHGYKNEKIKITFEKNSEIFFENYFQTDAHGNLEFAYDPNDCELCGNLVISPKPEKYFLKVLNENHPKNYQTFPITPWYTDKNSYLAIYRPQDERNLKCGQRYKFEMIIKTANSERFSNIVYFHLQSRSNFTFIGSYDIQAEKLNVQSGENEIFLEVKLVNKILNSKANLDQKFYIDGNPTNKPDEYIFELSFDLVAQMSPRLSILAYFIYENEIIPESLELDIPKCFENKVHFLMNKNNLRPGRFVNFSIVSDPNSICAWSAIDKSVSFMGNRNTLDIQKAFDALSKFEPSKWTSNNYETSQNCKNFFPTWPKYRPIPQIINEMPLKKRSIALPGYGYGSQIHDPINSFKSARVIYLSDLKIYRECPFYPAYAVPRTFNLFQEQGLRGPPDDFAQSETIIQPVNMPLSESQSLVVPDEEIIQTIRQFFPETWLWNIELSGENGLINKYQKVPDSITDWLIDSYCVSDKSGLGIAKTETLKVFQPVFISLNIPYSVIRGESFPVYATIFNYDSSCFPAHVEITADNGISVLSMKSHRLCICPNDEKTQRFNLKATEFDTENGFKIYAKVKSLVGQTDICNSETEKVTKRMRFFDSEIRSILVEPEGIPKENVKSFLYVMKDNQIVPSQQVDMSLPKNIVPRSSRVYLRVTGDAIGSVLNNLDKLVQQPTGCGEQNMVKFAPIVYVTNYLKQTDQMDYKMNKLTKDYLQIGYQRQLTYRHQDGAFSAFGPKSNTEGGGTWLTAFVLRSFADTYESRQIQIDSNDLDRSIQMLISAQDEDGSFRQVGAPLYSKALAGGLKNKKVGLSAYVMISLLKAVKALNRTSLDPNVQLSLSKGIQFLSASIDDVSNVDTYSLALSHFVFNLASINEESIEIIDQELDARATKEGDYLYWKDSEDDTSFSSRSADLEITSYILTSRLAKYQNLADLVPIAKWINSNRNSLGGFYSTQDTVVALEALSKFASVSFTKDVNLRLEYNLNSEGHTYFINNYNRLTSYTKKLVYFKEDGSNSFDFKLEGFGTVLVELIFKYNLVNENLYRVQNGFDFSIAPVSTGKRYCDSVKLRIKAKKNGDEDSNSMVIIGVRLPSGWEAVESSVIMLKTSNDLRRYELKENKLSLYFDELTATGKKFHIEAVKKFDIKDIKPGQIYVYDYYEPLENAITQQFEINAC
ncbi:alpha-2-macroglobulin 1 [Brachionus plicatilis]|uniref:Alpha-2-macroglobulin 1 n=1 Tax=Brachionus plicatilis TaxID=10195 RepID=A0A3M7QCT0_BRAPC|nr:alpha-2-macroglobulin 1 [Brachionus plicatilis]